MQKLHLFRGDKNKNEIPVYTPAQLKAIRKAKGLDQVEFKVSLNQDKVKALCKAMGFNYNDRHKAVKKLVERLKY